MNCWRKSAKGVEEVFVTLHVGLGTFRPVEEENIEDHEMHSEFYSITDEAAAAINRAKEPKGAASSPSVRRASAPWKVPVRRAAQGWLRLDEYLHLSGLYLPYRRCPGHKFPSSRIDAAHAHQRLSTREKILHAYEIAVQEKYRFFSFGDAMFIH
jgi:S-adenosylmethionine:tRNA ribosyltransferase-isomerase